MLDNLNEQEKSALKSFITNETAVEAVKKVLLADIFNAGVVVKDKPAEPRRNWVYGLIMNETGQDYKITNEELGEKVRAIVEGTRALELAFKEMEKLKDEPAFVEKIENPAR